MRGLGVLSSRDEKGTAHVDDYVDAAYIARVLGLHAATVRRHMAAGLYGPRVNVGGTDAFPRWRVRRSDFEHSLAGRAHPDPDDSGR